MGVKHASLAKIIVQSNSGGTDSLEIRCQMPMMTARLYKRVLEQATNVSVDIPVPNPCSEDVTLLEYPLPTLASMIVVEPLEVEYAKLGAPVLKALAVNSYQEAAIFDLINKAYQDKLGYPPTEHAYYKKLKELKYRINTSALMCQQKHSSLDEEAHKQLADNHMYEAFDELYAHLNDIEVEDPDKVGSAIQHQLDKINAFYKATYDDQRERLRQVKQQTDDTMRSLALAEARRKEEEQALHMQKAQFQRPAPPTMQPPVQHPGRANALNSSAGFATQSGAHLSSVNRPIPQDIVPPRRAMPITPAGVPLNQSGRFATGLRVPTQSPTQVDPIVVKTHVSLRESIARAREHAAQLLVSETTPAPMPVVDYGVAPAAPAPEPQPGRREFLQRLKVMKAEHDAQADAEQQVVVPQQPQYQHPPVVAAPVDPKKQAFLDRFKRAEQVRYGEVAV